MNRLLKLIALTVIGWPAAAVACDYTAGKTQFADYAKCRYGEEAIVVVDLPGGTGWTQCVYFVQAFRPEKLLAVTRMEHGREVASLNDRSQIGNPCYLTKKHCDQALDEAQAGGY